MIAEVESGAVVIILLTACLTILATPCPGISLWETVVDSNSRYGAMQSNFHTFTAAGKTYAIQFVR